MYVRICRHDGVPVVCVHVTVHACVHVQYACLRECEPHFSIVACGFSCRGVDHDTAVNLKGKLINWSTSDSSTSSPQNGLCSLTLERSATCSGEEGSDNSVMEHREGEKKKKRPPSLLPPPTLLPSLHLTDYECMSKEGRSDKKSQNRRKRPKSRTGVKYIH